jgi:putative intracellular protease/amidase
VKGKHVAGFTNGEEEEMQLTKADWQPFSVVDGLLVTGQNPASSTSSALALLESLTVQKAA